MDHFRRKVVVIIAEKSDSERYLHNDLNVNMSWP